MIGVEKKGRVTRLEDMGIKEHSRVINLKGKVASGRDSPNMSTRESSQLVCPIVIA